MKILYVLLGFMLLAAFFVNITGKKAKMKKMSNRKKNAFVSPKKTFKIDFEGNRFLKDGKPFQFISGDIHYFRIPQWSWKDRFLKMRHAGLNTVST